MLDTANPDPRLIGAIVEAAERVPDLRIVIDHLPHASVPAEKDAQDAYWANLRLLAASPRVFIKLSEIPVRVNAKLMTDPHFYQPRLDTLWQIFGEDHILFRQRLAEQRSRGPYRADLFDRPRICRGKDVQAQQKYLLEELDRGLPMGAKGARPAVTLEVNCNSLADPAASPVCRRQCRRLLWPIARC